METHTLVKALKEVSDRAHIKHDKTVGKRGGQNPQSAFYMGAYAVVDNILFAIENNDIKSLEQWAKE